MSGEKTASSTNNPTFFSKFGTIFNFLVLNYCCLSDLSKIDDSQLIISFVFALLKRLDKPCALKKCKKDARRSKFSPKTIFLLDID